VQKRDFKASTNSFRQKDSNIFQDEVKHFKYAPLHLTHKNKNFLMCLQTIRHFAGIFKISELTA